MFTFLSQLRETLQHGHPLHLSTIFVGTVWILWAVKVPLSRRYRPPASVGIPVVDKPLELFREVLRRIGEQTPDETIVVINGPRNPALEDVCNEFAGQLTWTWTHVASKRNTEGALAELLKPFADPSHGRRNHQAAHPPTLSATSSPDGRTGWRTGPAEPSRPSRTRFHRRPGTNL